MQPDFNDVTEEELQFALDGLRGQAAKHLDSAKGREVETEVGIEGGSVGRSPIWRNDEPDTYTSGRRTHPWDRWLNDEVHVAIQGRDFDKTPGKFRQMLYNKAKLEGLFVWTRIGSRSIAFAFFKTVEGRREAIMSGRLNALFPGEDL